MKWLIKACPYQVWSDFTIEVSKEIEFETGQIYKLSGNNGSGKSSFLKKILIPELLSKPEQQYVMYIEQQIQSQFDAVKAYAAFLKPAQQIHNFSEMIDFQLQQLTLSIKSEFKPCFIIIDECQSVAHIIHLLSRLKIKHYCLLFVSHHKCELPINIELINLNIILHNDKHSQI